MVLKKRIKVEPRDIDNKDKYYGAAALCPICGTNIREGEESRPLLLYDLTIPPKVLYVATRRKITFFCPTCGCSWSVKQFKRSETAGAARLGCNLPAT